MRKLPEYLWDGGNLISTEVKPCQIRQLPECLWNGGNLTPTKEKVFQIRQLPALVTS
jgi:hypothetical protein